MKKQGVLFGLVFCGLMAMSAHSIVQAKELNSHPPTPYCYHCFSPWWI
ncbi:hypothetical protein AB8989_06325 [Yersinia hibernica]|nr:hypothetical protein [Yersinia hibernica]